MQTRVYFTHYSLKTRTTHTWIRTPRSSRQRWRHAARLQVDVQHNEQVVRGDVEQLAREVSDGRIDKLRAEASAAGASAAGLKRKLVEAREWADSLLDELEAAQHVIGSLRRALGGASEQQHGQRGGGGSAHNKRARH